jgi:serine/threonine protein kinase
MEAATEGFAEQRKIDEGAFGAVFHGMLQPPAWPSGREVAIKVLKPEAAAAAAGFADRAQQFVGEGSFRKELEVLGKYRHRNLVELLGFCLSDGDGDGGGAAAVAAAAVRQCLVFEWMEGGSLRKRLAPAAAGQPPLAVQQRFDVASDVARGLRYLHVDATPPIIHQDIKTDNILLCVVDDGGGRPRLLAKIADFGTARIAPQLLGTGVSKIETQTVIGTKPYMPQEVSLA